MVVRIADDDPALKELDLIAYLAEQDELDADEAENRDVDDEATAVEQFYHDNTDYGEDQYDGIRTDY